MQLVNKIQNFFLLLSIKTYEYIFGSSDKTIRGMRMTTSNGEDISVDRERINGIDPYTHLYELHHLRDFMVENIVRSDKGEVLYCMRHLPTNRSIKVPKSLFELFFRKTALL